MNTIPEAPSISEFELHALEQVSLSDSEAQVSFTVELEHDHITRRIMFALLDENRQHGAAISIFPATGEVCDLINDGGVIGYLSMSPLMPNHPITCEILIYKFGKNWVCNVRVAGETFLYPAFMIDDPVRLTALVGHAEDGDSTWENDKLIVTGTEAAA